MSGCGDRGKDSGKNIWQSPIGYNCFNPLGRRGWVGRIGHYNPIPMPEYRQTVFKRPAPVLNAGVLWVLLDRWAQRQENHQTPYPNSTFEALVHILVLLVS